MQDLYVAIFRDVMHALADGFGYVIASLVGALVALTFSVPGEFPDIYYIGTILVALVGAVLIALLRRGIDSTVRPSEADDGSRSLEADDVIERLDAIGRELEGVRGDVKELQKPWWRRRTR